KKTSSQLPQVPGDLRSRRGGDDRLAAVDRGDDRGIVVRCAPVYGHAERFMSMLEGDSFPGPLAHDHDLNALGIQAEVPECSEPGRAGAQGRDSETGEEEDGIRGLKRRDGARVEIVPEIEHDVVEVRADDLEHDLDLL